MKGHEEEEPAREAEEELPVRQEGSQEMVVFISEVR